MAEQIIRNGGKHRTFVPPPFEVEVKELRTRIEEVEDSNNNITEQVNGFSSQLADIVQQKASKEELANALDGSPKGVYPTLIDLQTAFPAGTTGVYLVTSDGHIYSWDGAAWADRGVYQATQLDATNQAKINKSVEALQLKNYATNGRPDTYHYYTYLNATGSFDGNNKEINFTPTANFGQVQYNGFVTGGLSIQNKKIYARFKIKWAGTGTRGTVKSLLSFNSSNTSPAQVLPAITNEYQTVSVLFEKETYTVSSPHLKIYDENSSGFATITIKELQMFDLTEIFGNGMEPSKAEMDALLNSSSFFSDTLSSGISPKSKLADYTKALPLYVSFLNDELRVIAKYNKTQDIKYTLGKKGVNNIFDFKAINLIDNSSNLVSNNVNIGGAFWSNATDSFSPHVIKAVNNITGDKLSTDDFTGGNHGYDNTGTITGNSATGRTSSLTLKVEGRNVSSFEGYASYIEIIWTNMIQGCNTKKADGTGREILKETYRMLFDGVEWKIEYQSEPLEDVTYNYFYGLQLSTTTWLGGILYHSSQNKKWNNNSSVASDSIDIKANRMTLRDAAGKHFVDINIDNTFGIGTRDMVKEASPSAFHTNYNKCYWNLIKKATVAQGDILTFRGSYRFYAA